MTGIIPWLTWTAPLVALVALLVWRDGDHRLARFAGGALTFATLLAFVDPALSGGMGLTASDVVAAKMIATLALVAMSVVDARTRLVPPEFSGAWLAAGFVVAVARFVQVQDLSAVPYWVGFFALWQAGILGGGDAKLLMGAFGLWPDSALLGCVVGVTLIRGLGWVMWRYICTCGDRRCRCRGRAAQRLAQVTTELVMAGAGSTPPIQATFAATWAYALAVGVYLWYVER